MKRFYLVLLAVVAFSFVKGQAKSELKKSVGLSLGYSTGVGFTYKVQKDRWGLQGVLTPLPTSDYSFLSIAITPSYQIIEDEKTSLFAYQGNHYLYLNSDNAFVHSLGLGMQFKFSDKISLNLMEGMAMFHYESINPTGELSLLYSL